LQGEWKIVGMDQVLPSPSHRVLWASSGQFVEALVAIVDAPARNRGPYDLWDGLGQHRKIFFAEALCVCLLPLTQPEKEYRPNHADAHSRDQPPYVGTLQKPDPP
jgi:hypothetical protein